MRNFDPKLIPVLRIEFTLANGEVLTRDWTMNETHPNLNEVPSWLTNPQKIWGHPQDPVTFRGNVIIGFEDDARLFMGLIS